jgi:hypothetical protein
MLSLKQFCITLTINNFLQVNKHILNALKFIYNFIHVEYNM